MIIRSRGLNLYEPSLGLMPASWLRRRGLARPALSVSGRLRVAGEIYAKSADHTDKDFSAVIEMIRNA